jgi:hypothetical protein
MSAKQTLKIILTSVAILVATAHIIYPAAKIDMITVSLLAIAIIPWLEPLFKSVTLPGGFQFQFQDLKKLETDARQAGLITSGSNNESVIITESSSFLEIVKENKEMALLTLKIEIEKKLREIATSNHLTTPKLSTATIIDLLKQKNILSDNETSVLQNMLPVLSRGIHKTDNAAQNADWVIENGPSIISNLEKKIAVS